MWTAQQVIDEIRNTGDFDENELVTDTKMFSFINAAVRSLTAEMLKLGVEDKYYETNAKLSLVANQESYTLPVDMYISKIYKIIHQRPGYNEVRAIKRLRGMLEYEKYHDANLYNTTNPDYAYKILNKTAGPELIIVPTPKVAETNSITIWYARKPSVVSDLSHVIDVPEEMISYILTFVKVECLKVDVGNPLLQPTMNELKETRQLVIDTLTDQTHDSDNIIEPDLSHYTDMGVIP